MSEGIAYLFVGGLTTIINYTSFYFFYDIAFDRSNALFANLISFVLTTLFAFIANKRIVFKSQSKDLAIVMREFYLFVSLRIATFLLEGLGLWAAENLLYMQRLEFYLFQEFSMDGIMLAKVVLSVIAVLLNYIFSKWIIFKS